MWTVLVLICISSLSLSESLLQDPGPSVLNETSHSFANKNASVKQTIKVFNETKMAMVTTSPVMVTTGSLTANPKSPMVTEGHTPRTDDTSPAGEGTPDQAASRVPTPPEPTATGQTPPSTAVLSMAHAQAPSSSPSPRVAPLMTLATSAQIATAAMAGASGQTGTHSPSQHMPGDSTDSPMRPKSPHALTMSTQGPTVQGSTAGPVAGTTSWPAPTLSNTTTEPTTTLSVASVSTPVMSATKAQGREPAASTAPAPVPHTSPNPEVDAMSPTTQPDPAPSTQGAVGPGTPQAPEQVEPEASPGTASTRPTPGSSGDSKMPATDLCPLSTQGQYLVVTTEPLTQSLVSRSFLLAVLLLGVTLFVTVLVLFALQAYESYKKKDYTQVDYLINGMYADSEM
ncbi:uncharacterized protein C11orf24 homolog [Manis pentadactyla]|uniref:uncharacterized protein C11orf24 homolog n=1 Tax=Manis pentadactyla TaxID=143292 RepID=UPI001877366A|nr:uncharacterized protein C11orf24 homolog [Manis pentadactyla]XP_036731807.1 uncharacterized protein C11orf24 homolog [Manis pentadactyla]XP_036731810.1 uncharacterized protein C11orf24 homolog [Manis pentadactyla]XP_036731812.1 uncharacterized protein C11orf24 homolog [Manis pentadactyla]